MIESLLNLYTFQITITHLLLWGDVLHKHSSETLKKKVFRVGEM